jgi:putative membrane protein
MVTGLTAAILFADGFDMHGDFGSGWWVVMLVGMLIFWGLAIAGAVWLARELMRGRVTGGSETPLGLLDRRFAAGEVSVEEYRERRAVLTGEPPPPKID